MSLNPFKGNTQLPAPATRGGTYALLAVMSVVFLVPFYWLIVNSFKTLDQIFCLPPKFIPDPWVLGNFKAVFETTPFFRAFANSTFIAVAHCMLALFFCSLAGYAFAKYPKAPGRNILFYFVIGTMMIPGAVTLIPLYVILVNLHLINTYWAMIIPGIASAFGIFWMRQYIESNVHDDLIAAARIDGCSEFGIYWRVVVPTVAPAFAALGIIQLMNIWNNLMWAFIVLRTEDKYTLPLLVYLMQGEVRTPYGQVMALGLMTTLPLVIAFLLFQKHFIRGIMAGAIKG
ncbi:MAG: carbohydrate ABC transporter permease [Candidatus Sumerlaeota bacterium]|nr:carbohydrate ABC transporter permease [Candidatus Sumerlaeota bacterium]